MLRLRLRLRLGNPPVVWLRPVPRHEGRASRLGVYAVSAQVDALRQDNSTYEGICGIARLASRRAGYFANASGIPASAVLVRSSSGSAKSTRSWAGEQEYEKCI